MARETVVAIADINPGEAVFVYQGFVRPAYQGERKAVATAVSAIAKGETAIYEPTNRTLKRKE